MVGRIASVRVTTGSRLHFGLLSFGHADRKQFGGLGLMVTSPRFIVQASCVASGTHATVSEPAGDRHALDSRVPSFVATWSERTQIVDLPTIDWKICESLPEHRGFGAGTQLGLAVASCLFLLTRGELPEIEELAASVGRGLRSAIGAHGFRHGGLLFERGKDRQETLAPLDSRLELPQDWRVVLISPQHQQGLSGARERLAFAQLPPVPRETTARLEHLVVDHIWPAARAGDFESFAESLHTYGVCAGNCFAAHQGGPFATQELATWVQRLRRAGIRGVGQSSWGPTLFALVPDQRQAEDLLEWCAQELVPSRDVSTAPDLQIARIANHGAQVETSADAHFESRRQ